MTTFLKIERPQPPQPSKTIVNWFLAVLTALCMGVGLKESFMPTLTAIVGGGAGVIASYFIESIRFWAYNVIMFYAQQTGWKGGTGRFIGYWVYNPKGIRISTIALTLLVGACAAFLVEIVTGNTLNVGLSAASAFIGSQIAHIRALNKDGASVIRVPLLREIFESIQTTTDMDFAKPIHEKPVETTPTVPAIEIPLNGNPVIIIDTQSESEKQA